MFRKEKKDTCMCSRVSKDAEKIWPGRTGSGPGNFQACPPIISASPGPAPKISGSGSRDPNRTDFSSVSPSVNIYRLLKSIDLVDTVRKLALRPFPHPLSVISADRPLRPTPVFVFAHFFLILKLTKNADNDPLPLSYLR